MTEYRHIPGVTEPLPGSPESQVRNQVHNYVHQMNVPMLDPDLPEGLAALRERIRREPEHPKVIVYRGVPRCPWDGSAMPYTVFNAQRSIWDGPEPGYLFECEICGWEDEIS